MDQATIAIIVIGLIIAGTLAAVLTITVESIRRERNDTHYTLVSRVSELEGRLERADDANDKLRRKLADAVATLQNLTKHLTEEEGDGE